MQYGIYEKGKIMLKIGFIKTIKGEISAKEQTKALVAYGCILENIHDGDKDETILNVIASIRDPLDQVVIYSGAVVGRPHLKKLLREMSKIDNGLYNVKAEKLTYFKEGDEIASLIDDIERAERRRGGQGGKPNSIGVQVHTRILKMAGKGLNSREITEQLNLTRKPKENKGKPYEKTTIWRYMKKSVIQCKS